MSEVSSQGKCSETVGVAPLRRWTTAQSSILSKISRGSPGIGKRANRVPPVPTAQLGVATAKVLTFSVMASMSMPRRSNVRASAS